MPAQASLPNYAETVAELLLTTSGEAAAFHLPNLAARWSDYGPAARTTIALGIATSSSDYVIAQRLRTATMEALSRTFESFDLLVLPTLSRVAPPYLENADARANGEDRCLES